MRARRNGTAPIPPGSSSNSCSASTAGLPALPSRTTPILFNSYYVSAGPRHARHQRGLLTRPGAEEITAYRRHVDAAVVKFFQTADEDALAAIAPLVEVGLNHEQQHQELMLTDILHAFAQNPIPPAYDPDWRFPASTHGGDDWVTLNEGIHTVGHADDSFHFDNEKPAHRVLVGPSSLRATSSPMPNGSPS